MPGFSIGATAIGSAAGTVFPLSDPPFYLQRRSFSVAAIFDKNASSASFFDKTAAGVAQFDKTWNIGISVTL